MRVYLPERTSAVANASSKSHGRAAFERDRRLTHTRSFASVFKSPTRSSDKLFTVLGRANTLTHARLGLAISKRAVAKASARNRIKRIVRESFRLNPRLPSIDVVVMAKPGAGTQDNQILRTSLERHWARFAARSWTDSASGRSNG